MFALCFGAGYHRGGGPVKADETWTTEERGETMHPSNPPTHSLPLPTQEAVTSDPLKYK